jgi:hypothetical protein
MGKSTSIWTPAALILILAKFSRNNFDIGQNRLIFRTFWLIVNFD